MSNENIRLNVVVSGVNQVIEVLPSTPFSFIIERALHESGNVGGGRGWELRRASGRRMEPDSTPAKEELPWGMVLYLSQAAGVGG